MTPSKGTQQDSGQTPEHDAIRMRAQEALQKGEKASAKDAVRPFKKTFSDAELAELRQRVRPRPAREVTPLRPRREAEPAAPVAGEGG